MWVCIYLNKSLLVYVGLHLLSLSKVYELFIFIRVNIYLPFKCFFFSVHFSSFLFSTSLHCCCCWCWCWMDFLTCFSWLRQKCKRWFLCFVAQFAQILFFEFFLDSRGLWLYNEFLSGTRNCLKYKMLIALMAGIFKLISWRTRSLPECFCSEIYVFVTINFLF